MRILYLGGTSGTSRHRSDALIRSGHDVDIVDPRACFGHSQSAERWIWYAGALGMEPFVNRYVMRRLRHPRYDICIVNHGELIGPALLRSLRKRIPAILHFNLDNPFVDRDRRRWRVMRKAIPGYDAIATPRASTAEEGYRRGASHMIQFTQAADEVIHTRHPYDPDDERLYGSDVSFIGTWMPERGALIRRLRTAGVKVKVFGPNWEKAPDYQELASCVAVSGSLGDHAYPRAIQYARIALGFLSQGNEDQHTSRSVEVPAIGTLLCAKRTEYHREMYREGEEAIFWEDMDECAQSCINLLAAPDRLEAISAAGAARQKSSGNWNQQLLERLMEETLSVACGK